MSGRLYLVTRADLPPGSQACQAAHAAIEFALTYPAVAAANPGIVIVAARDELDLAWRRADAVAAGLRVVTFHEPDLGGALTALAVEPAAARLLARLPLALADSPTSSGRGEVRT